MANTRIRIYNREKTLLHKPATWIGLSANACAIETDTGEAWNEFFDERGYDVRAVNPNKRSDRKVWQALGSPSVAHYEIRPPMSDEDIQAFGALCTEHVDPGNNLGILIDNRQTPQPIPPYSEGGPVLATWV